MPNSSVPTERDGGHNPASATARKGPTHSINMLLFRKVIQPKLDYEQVVDMGSYLADWAPKRLKTIKKGLS